MKHRTTANGSPENDVDLDGEIADANRGTTSATRRETAWVTWVIIMAILAGLAVLNRFKDDPAVFGVVLGVFVSVIVTTLPTAAVRWWRWRRRLRTSSYLWRTDIYSYQEWIVCSIEDGKWAEPPQEVSTMENLADLASWAGGWEPWEPITTAHRYTKRLLAERKEKTPEQNWKLAKLAFDAINIVREDLAPMDGGPKRPHRKTGCVAAWAAALDEKEHASASSRRRGWRTRRSRPRLYPCP